MNPRIIRAVDLIEGDHIFLAATGGWTRRLAEAAIASNEREAAALLAAARMQPDVAEAPRLVDVRVEGGRPRLLPAARTTAPRPASLPQMGREAAGHA